MKIFTGKVINTNKAKTATVEITRLVAHSVYGKRVKKTKKYHVHDENQTSKVGDIVKFVASRPYSKLKKWALLADRKETKNEVKKEKAAPARAKASQGKGAKKK